MSCIEFRIVVPIKRDNVGLVYLPHPTDMFMVVPEFSNDWKPDSQCIEQVAVNDTIKNLMVFKSGSDFMVLESEYQAAKRWA